VKPDDALDDALDAQTSEPIADIFPHAPPSRDTRKFLKRAQKVHNHLIATNSAAPVDLMQEGPKVKYVSTTIRLLKPLMRRYTRLAKRLKVSRNELWNYVLGEWLDAYERANKREEMKQEIEVTNAKQ
jgi:hypothetical protein